jgi:hypothetical protein
VSGVLALLRGEKLIEIDEYTAAAAEYRIGLDNSRARLADAWTAWAGSYVDWDRADRDWSSAFPTDLMRDDRALTAIVQAFRASVAAARSDYHGAYRLYLESLGGDCRMPSDSARVRLNVQHQLQSFPSQRRRRSAVVVRALLRPRAPGRFSAAPRRRAECTRRGAGPERALRPSRNNAG